MNEMQSGKQEWLGHCLNCRPGRRPEQWQCMSSMRSARHLALVRVATKLGRRCERRLGLSPGRLAIEARTVLPESDFHGRKQASYMMRNGKLNAWNYRWHDLEHKHASKLQNGCLGRKIRRSKGWPEERPRVAGESPVLVATALQLKVSKQSTLGPDLEPMAKLSTIKYRQLPRKHTRNVMKLMEVSLTCGNAQSCSPT